MRASRAVQVLWKLVCSLDVSRHRVNYAETVNMLLPQDPVARHGPLFGEVVGLAPALFLCALFAWFALAQADGKAEAGLGRRAQAPIPAAAPTTDGSGARTDQRLFIVTVGHERALEISALLRADSNLRVLLGEAPRDAEIIEAGTDEQAADITAAIRGDLVALGPALAAVVVR